MRQLWRTSLIIGHISSGMVLLVITGAVWRPYTPAVRKTMQWWLRRVTDILNMEVEIIGELSHENEGAVLLVSNHVSWVDIPLIGGVTPISFLSKAEVARWPLIGTLATKVGTLFIQRGAGDADRVSRTIADTLRKKRSVLFFPEGTTTDGVTIKRFHHKLFRACHHHPVIVQPVVVRYWSEESANPVPFIGDDEFTTHLWNMMAHRKLYAQVHVLTPFALNPADMQQQVTTLECQMRHHLHVSHGHGLHAEENGQLSAG